jgi:hypothetical protein
MSCERSAGLEKSNVGADPAIRWGRPLPYVSGEQNDPTCGPTGVLATACLQKEIDATREILAVRLRNLQPDTREG